MSYFVHDGNLAKAAIEDPDTVRRLAVWLAARDADLLDGREKRLLDACQRTLTVWSDWDEADPA